ncbi:unnamed protein product [Triticum aestivum]|uniref:Terpene synthase n=2 Tax=Triticum aestivum TaxID=4565 RepID=A0A9R1EMD6_WHEAT|nr:(E)-beta-caryophyllene synthase-like [Triticum aestivum]KAF7012876.1 hypothetical protein CFC21_027024 [Triticum aestivum]SPT15470.1 unnamed protein product [Triticum aestivum]
MVTNNSIPPLVQDDVHKPRPYPASQWGDFFLNYKPCTPQQYRSMEGTAEAKKEEVRKIIIDTAKCSDLTQKLELVYTLQRIGVDYHYGNEIDELLCDIYDGHIIEPLDLRTASLQFYLLRKHGYCVSSDVFSKFIDKNGNIGSTDATSLLGLYNAAYLRTHGEKILDVAMSSTKKILKSIVNHLDPTIADEIRHHLETPLFRGTNRVETKRYISAYEKNSTRNETILEFAKLDYNLVQGLYCDELKDLTIWWNGFDIQTHLTWARDRMVEIHFWMMGVLFEPHYSYPRVVLTKLFTLVSVFDDFYDNYSTTEESNMFTTAINRWDEHAVEHAPAYMRPFYKGTVASINQIEEDLKLQENKHAELVKKLFIDAANCYHAEVKWRDQKYVPANLEEHLKISAPSTICMQISNIAFLLMGDITSSETIQWAWAYPTIIRAVCIIARVMNDIVSHEREQASEHMVSTVQTCMNENGCTVEEANEKLNEVVEQAWMDICESCIQPTAHPLAVLSRVANLARVTDFLYKHDDGYTLGYSVKGTLDSVYVHPMDV